MQNKESHIASAVITRYALYLFAPRKSDYDGQRLCPEDILSIELHLNTCKKCTRALKKQQKQLSKMSDYLDEQPLPEVTLGKKTNK